MKNSKWLRVLAALFLLGCEVDDVEVGADEASILNGGKLDPKIYGVARYLRSAGLRCSLSLLEADLGVTTRDCLEKGTLELASATSKVKTWRGTTWTGIGSLVIVQSAKPLPVNGPSYSRWFDKRPLAMNEVVYCYGYGDGDFRFGSFEVIDMDDPTDPTSYQLQAIGFNGYETLQADVGGFCQRDGNDIAAVVSKPSTGGVFPAIAAHRLDVAVTDWRAGAAAARARTGAVFFRNPANDERMTALGGGTHDVRMEGPAVASGDQAFFLEKATVPWGGSDWFRLISAADGRCVVDRGLNQYVGRASCSGAREEYFQLRSLGSFAYQMIGRSGCVTPGNASSVACAGAGAFDMWLAGF
jgi:hypothetical protein